MFRTVFLRKGYGVLYTLWLLLSRDLVETNRLYLSFFESEKAYTKLRIVETREQRTEAKLNTKEYIATTVLAPILCELEKAGVMHVSSLPQYVIEFLARTIQRRLEDQ